jgi:hypothetical protein
MSTSAWGVDHGADELSKGDRKFTENEKLTGAVTALSSRTPVGPVVAGFQGKKGKRAKVGFKSAGRGIAEGVPATLAGAGIGALTRNPNATMLGAQIGGAAGTTHGLMASMRNSRKRGYMK